MLWFIASDGMGWSQPDFVTISVAEILPPVAVADANVTTGPAPLTVTFDGSQSFDPMGGNLIYQWSFGDGSSLGSEVSVVHVYIFPGTYNALLTVVDSLGQIDVDTIKIDVTTANTPPVASPTVTPQSGPAPLVVQFAANASDADGDTLTYAWDFGDDAVSSAENPNHTYVSAGTFTAWLTVSDGQNEVTESLLIVVDPGLEITPTAVRVRYKGPKSTLGAVSVDTLYSGSGAPPAPSDLVQVQLDGITLLSVPFADFTLAANDNQTDAGDANPGLYKYKAKHLRAEIDTTNGRLYVSRNKVNLLTLNNSNGVDVAVQFGDRTAVGNVLLLESNGNTLVYDAGL